MNTTPNPQNRYSTALAFNYSPVFGLKYRQYFATSTDGNHDNKTTRGQKDYPSIGTIAISELYNYVAYMKLEEDAFKIEHSYIPEGVLKPCQVAEKAHNRFRNRYSNILAYDETRVILPKSAKNPDGYINANYIDTFDSPKAYIATQGPIREYFDEFWEMVWQERANKIVMLTRLMENKTEKCDRYWPTTEERYGNFRVKMVKTFTTANYMVFDLEIARVADGGNKAWRPIRLYWFLSWPDFGVPDKTTEFLSFFNFVKSRHEEKKNSGSTIVHCSAGVGRTGTFIALDSMLAEGRETGKINLFAYIKQMRIQRCSMVQSPEQYEFLYDMLLESLVSGGTFISCDDTNFEYFNKIVTINPESQKTLLEEQWQILSEMEPPKTFDPYRMINKGRLKENIYKNYDINVVPFEARRPKLQFPGGYPMATDYINATFVNGSSNKSDS